MGLHLKMPRQWPGSRFWRRQGRNRPPPLMTSRSRFETPWNLEGLEKPPRSYSLGTGDCNTSNELLKQAKSGGAIKEEDNAKEDPMAELTSEVWGSKDDEGSTHAFLDDEKNVDIRGEEDESFLGELGSWRRSYRNSD